MNTPSPNQKSSRWEWVDHVFRIPFGVALPACVLGYFLVAIGIQERRPADEVLLYIVIAGGFYLSMVDSWWNENSFGGRTVIYVFAGAVLSRLALLSTMPYFSDDIYRYVWEGRVIAAGLNPFALAPDAPELAFLRGSGDVWRHINYPSISAIYPPLPQGLFALVAAAGGGVFSTKVLMTLADLAVGGLLWRWIEREGLPRGRIVVWLFHPLVVIEFSGSGHLDVLMILGLVGTLVALQFRHGVRFVWSRPLVAVLGLTIGAMAKLAPLVLLPHLARHIRPRAWWMLLLPPLLLAVSYTGYLSAGDGLFRAMDSYEARWRNNDSVFRVIHLGVESLDPDGAYFRSAFRNAGSVLGIGELDSWMLKRRPESVPGDPNMVTARLVVYLLFGAVWVFVFFIRDAEWDDRWLWLFGSALLLSPVNHPWYLTLLIPCMLRRFRPAVMWWSLTVMASYLALDRYWEEGVWKESTFAWWLQYGGLAAIGVWTLAKLLRARKTGQRG